MIIEIMLELVCVELVTQTATSIENCIIKFVENI